MTMLDEHMLKRLWQCQVTRCLNFRCSVMCQCVETFIIISGKNMLKRTENNVVDYIRSWFLNVLLNVYKHILVNLSLISKTSKPIIIVGS
jgi:hypothetical protein